MEHREDKECRKSMMMRSSIVGEGLLELKRKQNSFMHESSQSTNFWAMSNFRQIQDWFPLGFRPMNNLKFQICKKIVTKSTLTFSKTLRMKNLH